MGRHEQKRAPNAREGVGNGTSRTPHAPHSSVPSVIWALFTDMNSLLVLSSVFSPDFPDEGLNPFVLSVFWPFFTDERPKSVLPSVIWLENTDDANEIRLRASAPHGEYVRAYPI